MQTGKKIKIAAAAILLAAALLIPEIVSAAWHLIYGEQVAYRSWKVDVPFEWYAAKQGEGMTVERMMHLSWEKGPVAYFQPMHFGKSFKMNYRTFGAEQAQALKDKGYVYDGLKEVHIAGQDGRCWTYTRWQHQDRLWIACVVPGDLTSVDFLGSREYEGQFYSVLQGIQHLKSAN